jgi:hypothetical protein
LTDIVNHLNDLISRAEHLHAAVPVATMGR